ncbi:unnamed protein product, partial [Prorocentrum cordatum]
PPGDGAASPKAGTGSWTPKPSTSETNEDSQPEMERRPAHTLSSSLHVLSSEDPDCIIIVRRINKLGFKAVRKLRQHFSSYGTVVRMLVAHSTVNLRSGDQAIRQRPSSLGFLHMSAPDAAQAILALGPEQEVDGVTIRVQRFERSSYERQDLEGESGADKDRQSSDAGTSAATTGAASSGGAGSSYGDTSEKADSSERADPSERADSEEKADDSSEKADSQEKADSDKVDSEG